MAVNHASYEFYFLREIVMSTPSHKTPKKKDPPQEQAQMELERECARLHGVIDGMIDAHYVYDRNWRFIELDQSAAEYFGRPQEELMGRNVWELFPSSVGNKIWTEFHHAVAEGVPVHFEMQSAVNSCFFEIHAYPEPRGLAVYLHDITERKRAEEEIQRKTTDLEALNEELSTTQEELRCNYEELRQTEHDLRETTQYLENLITYANAPIVVLNPNLQIIRLNHAFELLTGRSAESMVGRYIEPLFPETQREEIMLSMIRQIMGDKPWDTFEIPILHANGLVKTVIWNSAFIYDTDGTTVLSIIVQGQDITERKNAEMALVKARDQLEIRVMERTADLKQAVEEIRRERQQLYDVLETLPVYVYLLTPDYHMPFSNRCFREAFGEPQGKCCYDFFYHRMEPCETCETYTVLKTRAPHHWFWTGPNGRDYSVFDSPFTDNEGSFLILEMGIDITDQRRAEESLWQAGDYNRSLIEASPDPLVTISTEGKITDVNEATIKATGVSRTELIGTDFSDYFTEPERAKAGYLQVFEQGHVTDYPLTLRGKDGRLTHVLYNATLYRDSEGKVRGIFAAARDVTERKRVELELREYHDHLEELVKERTEELNEYAKNLKRSNEDLERFAYIASHDLQEPLRNVVSFSQLLARKYQGKLNPDADEFISYIVEGGKRMQALVQDLLEYSRVNTRGQAFRVINSEEIVDPVLQNLTISIQESDAVIRTTPLPTILADPSQIALVFQNLIGNAIKFRTFDMQPHIAISAERMGEMWKFAVKDNGIGIDPAFYDRIFEIFQRLHTRDKYPGTGVGLAIVKKIIERHGGKIWVESELGKGSTFYFTLRAAGGI
jgi:PAS domain S-box-containing protein